MARRLAAILAADVVGYSRLMAADERDTHERLKVLRKDFIEPTIAEHRGRVVKLTGDGALVEFASVVDSVECAAAIQNCVAERQSDVPEDQRIALRIGVNIGDIIIEDDDIYGDGVNVAARLESLAEPGGICVSRTVYDHAKNKVALGFQPMGEHVVKNIPEPVVVYRVTPAGAAAGAPWTAGATDRARRNVPAIVVAIALVIGGGAASWVWSRSNTPSDASPSPAAEPILAMPTGPTVAVLPFNNLSGDRGQEYFSDGITEEILTALSRFRNLHVVARNATFQYKGKSVDVQRVGAEIGAEYVLEGSVRRAGETVRVTAQLIDTGSGSHLWADTYDRAVDPANLFEVQDDIAAKVAAAVAASYGGAISATGLRSASGRPPERLSSYECVLETFGIWRGQSAELVERSRDCLVVAVERDPGYADAWAMLSLVYQYQRWYGWGLQPPESHDLDQRAYLARKAVEAAQKAVKLAPDSATANYSLACAYWAAGDTEKFRIQTERALSLNPHDPSFLGALGNYLAYAGWWDEGVAMVEKAVALAPTSYATWWLWAIAKDHFRKGEYVRALAGFERAFIPGFWLSQLQLAYTHGMLGNTKQAAQAVARLQELMPGFSTSEALAYYRMWNFEPSYLDRMAEGLRRAGLPQDPHRISG